MENVSVVELVVVWEEYLPNLCIPLAKAHRASSRWRRGTGR